MAGKAASLHHFTADVVGSQRNITKKSMTHAAGKLSRKDHITLMVGGGGVGCLNRELIVRKTISNGNSTVNSIRLAWDPLG